MNVPVTTMKAMIQCGYGSPDVLQLRDIEKPAVLDDSVLVRVKAASVSAFDWQMLRLPPVARIVLKAGIRRPKRQVPCVDAAGVVEAVGKNVTEFKPGDEVFGNINSSCAEYVRGRERHFALKPARLTFEQAAAIPASALTALQGLRDAGRVRAGQRVLINGAGGGIGSFAVQIAKALGAHVTAVTQTGSMDMVRSIGADRIIDRSGEDFTRAGIRYDVIYDLSADRRLSDLRRALAPEGTLVMAGAPPRYFLSNSGLLKLGGRAAWARLMRDRVKPQKIVQYIKKPAKADLVFLANLVESGKLIPVVDHIYPMREAATAVRHVEERRARGKVVLTV